MTTGYQQRKQTRKHDVRCDSKTMQQKQ